MLDFSKYEKHGPDSFSSDQQYRLYLAAFKGKTSVIVEYYKKENEWAVALLANTDFWLDVFKDRDEALAFCEHFKFKVREIKV